jgi:hypothetical protein
MRRPLIESLGGYRAEFPHAEDYDLWLRISERAEVANLERPVISYRTHGEQVSVRHREQQVISAMRARQAARRRALGQPDTPLLAQRPLTRQERAQVAATQAWLEYRRRSSRRAVAFGLQALATDPAYVVRYGVRAFISAA